MIGQTLDRELCGYEVVFQLPQHVLDRETLFLANVVVKFGRYHSAADVLDRAGRWWLPVILEEAPPNGIIRSVGYDVYRFRLVKLP